MNLKVWRGWTSLRRNLYADGLANLNVTTNSDGKNVG